jgi:hypothetical protein
MRNTYASTQDTAAGARAMVVNRTHRVVREAALTLRAQRTRSRSLWVPLALCSVSLLTVCYAIWAVLDGYDLMSSGVPDASDQILILLLWSLPVTAMLLGVVWLRRARSRGNDEAPQ